MIRTRHLLLKNLGLCAVVTTLTLPASAADQRWTGSSALWNATANWSGGALPAATDLAIFNNLSTGNLSNVLGQSFSIKGLVYTNLATAVSINVTTNIHTLTLGASGVDMTTASSNLTIAASTILGAAQTWAITTSRTLTVSRPLSGSGNLIKDLPGTLSLTGTNTFTGTLTVNSGRLLVGSTGALGSASSPLIVNSGGQMNWGASYALSKSHLVSGNGLASDGALRAGGNSASVLTGNVTLLTDSLALKMDGGSSFTLNGTLVGTNRNLTITLDGSATSTVNGGVMLGTGSFTKASTSTLTLTSATNFWSGGTTIAGTLNIGNGGAASLGTGAIANSGTLTFNSSTPLLVNDLISGTGALNQNGAGAVTLGGANTYSGNTTIGSAGNLTLSATGIIPNSYANTLTVNGLLDVSAGPGTYTLGGSQTLAGSGTVLGNVTASSGATVTGTQTINGNLTTSAGTKVLPGGAAFGTLTVAGNLSLGGPTVTYDLSAATTEGSGTNDELVVNGNLILNGTTTIVLNFRNGPLAPGAYTLIRYAGVKAGTGTFALDQAYLGLSVDTSVAGLVRLVVATPATLTWVGDSTDNFWDIGLTTDWTKGTGPVAFQQLNSVRFDDTGSTYPPVNLTATLQPTVVTVDTATSYTLAGTGKLGGGASLVKTNTGTLAIQTTNDYTGPTIIQQGTLSLLDVGTFPAAGGISIATSAILSFSPSGTVSIGATVAPAITGGGTFQTYSGVTALGNQGNTAYKVNMKLSPGAIIDVAGGTLMNGGWQGGVWTDGLTWTNLADLSVAGTFDVWDGNPVYVNKLDGNGSVGTGMNAGTRYLYVGADNGSGTFSGTVACNLTGATNSTLVFVKIGSGTQYLERFTRGAGGGGTPTVNVNGGTLTLGGTADNAYTTATVNGGTLELAKYPSTAAVHSLGSGTLTVNSNGVARITGTGGDQIHLGVSVAVNAGGTFDLNGQSEVVNALSGAGLIETTTGPATLTVGANNGGGTFAGLLTDYSGNALALGKLGTGTQIITGTNAYTGGTTVTLGTLQYGNGTINSVPSGDIGLVNTTNPASAQLRFVVSPTNTAVHNGNITNGPAPGGGNLYVAATNAALVLGGVNTFIGNVVVNSGNLWIKNSSGLGIGPKLVDLSNGTAGNPSLHLDGSGGNIDLVGTISYNTSAYVTGAIVNEAGDNTIGGPITLTSGGGDTGIYVNGGTLTLTGAITPNTTARNLRLGGAGNGTVGSGGSGFIADGTAPNTLAGLRKLDAGTWTLNGNNNYSGTTTVEGGTLVIGESGTLPLTPTITIFSNATLNVAAVTGGFTVRANSTLNGTGAVVGNLATADGVTVNPGTKGNVGTFAFANNLTFTATTTNNFDLRTDTTPGSGFNDLITVGGDLNPQGATIFINLLAPLTSPGTYRLFNYTGTLLSSFNATVLGGDSRFTLTLDESVPNQINLIVGGVASSLTWYGDLGTNTWNLANAAPWNYNTEKFYNADAVTFDDTAITNIATLAGTLVPASVTVNNSALNYTLQGTGKISGSAGIAKSGTGVLRINTANDFTGPVTVSEGTLMAGSATAFGATNGTVTIASGATLDVNAQNLGQKPVVASGAGIAGNGTILNSSATAQINALNTVTLTGDTVFGGVGRWDIRANGMPFASLNTLGNPYKITKIGTNQVSLVSVAVDPALADVDITAGLFGYEVNCTGLGNPANKLTIWPNAQLQFWGPTNLFNKPIILNGGTNWCLNNGSGTATVVAPVTLNAPSIINVGGTSLTLSGPIGETTPASITKTGTGNLILNATNTFTGNLTNLNAGTVTVMNNAALGTNKLLWVNSTTGGTGLTGTRVTLAGGVTTPQSVSVSMNSDTVGDIRSTFYSDAGTNEWRGPVEMRGSGNNNVVVESTNGFIISGPVTGAAGYSGTFFIRGAGTGNGWVTGQLNLGNGKLTKTDAGTWTIGSTGNSWSASAASVGTLRLAANDALCLTAPLTMGQSDANAAMLDLNGYRQTVPNLITTGGGGARRIGNDSTTADSVFTYAAGTNVNTFAGQFLDNLTTNGTRKLGLTVASGTLYLTGSNSNTGPTLVTGGFLGGTGILLSPVTVLAGGTLAPGTSVGTLTVSNRVTLGGTTLMEITKTGYLITNDLVRGVSTLTYGGTLQLALTGAALVVGETVKLFDAATYAGAFTSITPAPGAGLAWDTSALATTGTLKVKIQSDAPSISTVGVLPDGNISLTLNGVIGQPYSVRISTNVALPFPWPVLSSGTIPSMPFVYSDLTATNYQERFYIISSP